MLMNLSTVKSLRTCPCCRYDTAYLLKVLNYRLFDHHPLPNRMHLMGCAACGFVYYDGDFDERHLEEFYQKHYFINSYQHRADHPAEKAYNESSIDILVKNHISFNANIVDVGCGPGHLLKQMRQRGFKQLSGVELSAEYVDGLREAGFNAYLGSSMQLPIVDENKVDCFIYKNIFEHLFTLHESIQEIIHKIANGGYVLVEVPDASMYAHFEQYHPLHYFTLEHINHFDMPHLQALFKIYGFKSVDFGTRMLDIAEPFPVPIMYCLFRKEAALASSDFSDIVLNQSVKSEYLDFQLVKSAITWFKDQEDFNKQELCALKASQKPVYIWGLAYRTLMQCAMSPLNGCPIKSYISSFAQINPRFVELWQDISIYH